MTLSHSRRAYYELVLNQTTETFVNCHINAFEAFGGVPKTVKIDNLKAAVLEKSFYHEVFQQEYKSFLNHYQTSGITCRIRRGQDKGKVESGVKYVKNNFIKGLRHKDFYQAQEDLKTWTDEICNKRVHGTTKKIPIEMFNLREKTALIKLPNTRYEFYKVFERIVNTRGHVSYANNEYSVPAKYLKEKVYLK